MCIKRYVWTIKMIVDNTLTKIDFKNPNKFKSFVNRLNFSEIFTR